MSGDLIQTLAAQAGTGAVAAGAFTLDRAKAKEKLRHFQLSDPCAWLLEVVRGAVALDATFVDVRTDSDDIEVRFDGRPITHEDVDEIYAALLARNAPAARAHLAVALNAVMALEPKFARLESIGVDGSGLRLEVRPGRDDVITPIAARPRKPHAPGTRVHVQDPFRIGRFVKYFRALSGTQREVKALQRACRFSPIPVRINGRRVAARPPQVNGDRGAEPGVLALLHRGVVLEEGPHPVVPAGMTAAAEGVGLARDASLQAFLRDPNHAALVDRLLAETLAGAEAAGGPALVAAALSYGEPLIALARGAPSVTLGEAINWPLLAAALRQPGLALRRERVLFDARMEAVDLDRLIAEIARHGQVASVRRAARSSALPRLFVWLRDEIEERRFFELVGDARVDGTESLALAELRAEHHQKLLTRKAATRLPPDAYLARVELKGTFRGELALRRHGSALVMHTFTDGCLIASEQRPCVLPGLSLAIEAPFALNATCDAPIGDATFAAALVEAWHHIPALLAQIDADVPTDVQERVRAIGVPFLLWAADPIGLRRRMLEELHKVRPLVEPLPADPQLPAPPSITLTGQGAHPIVRVPLVPRVDGQPISLAALAAAPHITVVPAGTRTFSDPAAIPAGPTLREVLATLRPLRIEDELAQREGRRAAVLERRARSERTDNDGDAQFRDGTVSGAVSLSTAPGIALTLEIERRQWWTVHLPARIGPLRLRIDATDALPLVDGAPDPADIVRWAGCASTAVRSALALALGSAAHAPASRAFAFSIIEALFPHPGLRAVADRLSTAEYMAILEAFAGFGPADIDALIACVIEAEQPLTVASLRATQEQLGIGPVSDLHVVARRVELALLGGAAALAKAHGKSAVLALLRSWAPLEQLALRRLDMSVVALRKVVAAAERAPLPYVPPETERLSDIDHLVLDAAQVRGLSLLLGANRLVDRADDVRAGLARRAFEKLPVESARLHRDSYPDAVEVKTGSTVGEVALTLPRGEKPTATVRVLCRGRFVTSLELVGETPVSLVGVVDDPSLPLTADHRGIASDAARNALITCVCAAADRAIDAIVAEASTNREGLEARAPQAALSALERLAHTRGRPLSDARRAALVAAPLIGNARGGWLSVLALRAAAKKGAAAFVAEQPSTSDLASDPELVLALAPSLTWRTLLPIAAGAKLKDAEVLWTKARELAQHKASLAPFPALPDRPLAKVEHERNGGRLVLWCAGEGREGVHVGAGGRTVEVIVAHVPLRGVRGFIDAPHWVDAQWRAVDHKALRKPLDAACLEMAELLVAAAVAGDDGRAVTEAQQLVLTCARRTGKLRKAWRELFAAIKHEKLFAVADGARISLADALVSRPPSLETMLVVAGLIDLPEAPVADPPADGDTPDSDSAPVPIAAPVHSGPAPAALALRARLEETLGLVKLDADAAAELARWPIDVAARGGKTAVVLQRGRTVVDLEHPLVVRALSPDDPCAYFMLCAVVYGAINAHLDAVTADHERTFLGRLIAHARSAQ